MYIINKFLIHIIKFYQLTISPFLGHNCRYQPTCSSYLIGCLKKYNFGYGLYLGLKRIFNCHPFSGSGYDPVP